MIYVDIYGKLPVSMIMGLLFIFVQHFRFSAGCLEELTTDTYPPFINYTGNSCTWKITAPVTNRVILTIQRFQPQTIVTENSCPVFLELSDEVGSVTTCPRTQYPEYISDANFIYVSLNSSSEIAISELVIKVAAAEELFFCDFDPDDSCTRQVDDRLLWHHERGLNVEVCPLPSLDYTGLFYEITMNPMLFTKSLAAGGYLLTFDIQWICESRHQFSAKFLLTTCTAEPKEIAVDNTYRTSRHYVTIIECDEDFDLVLGPLEFVSGLPSIFIDNVRLMNISESGPPVDPDEGPPVEPGKDQGSFSELFVIVVIAAASSLFILLVVIICICVLVRRRTRTRCEEPSRSGVNTRANFENHTYDSGIPLDQSHPYEDTLDVGNIPEYHDVNDGTTTTTDNGRTIDVCENAIYESYATDEDNST